jgi:hypothetical protein
MSYIQRELRRCQFQCSLTVPQYGSFRASLAPCTSSLYKTHQLQLTAENK